MCSVFRCEAKVPWLARLAGWRKSGDRWLCPRHRDYTAEDELAEMKAAFRDIDPRVGWADELSDHRAAIVRGRPAFLTRERRELEELVPLCEDSATAEQVVDRLRRIGQESTSRLCDFVLADHRNRRVAFYAIEALAEINEPIARDAIIRACGHDEPWVRVGAVGALERVPDERRVGVLLTLLGDEQVQVRDAS